MLKALPALALFALSVAACSGGGGDITFKIHDKPVETAKVGSSLTNGQHFDLFLGCKVDCDIYEGATCAGCVNMFKLEKACGAGFRYIDAKLSSGPLAPGKYPLEKFSLELHDSGNGANLLFEAKTATLDITSATSASFTTDSGGHGTISAKSCK